MSRQATTQADAQRAVAKSGGERAREVDDDRAEAPLQLMVGPGVGTTALSALMAAGGNVQMAQLSRPVQRSADRGGEDKGGEDKLRLVVSVLENKLGRELKGADVKVVRDQLKGREGDPTPELVRDLLPMLGGETPVQQRAAGAVQRQAGGGEDTGAVHAAAARGIAGGGGSLPYAAQIQQSFGRHDVSGVKGHVGGAAREASEAMGAQAYATGDHVAFKGQPDLHTAAHEAAHVVQQRAGVSLKGGVGQVGDAYERHADAVADRVVQGKSAEDLLDQMAGGGAATAVQKQSVQRAANTAISTAEAAKVVKALMPRYQALVQLEVMLRRNRDQLDALVRMLEDEASRMRFSANLKTELANFSMRLDSIRSALQDFPDKAVGKYIQKVSGNHAISELANAADWRVSLVWGLSVAASSLDAWGALAALGTAVVGAQVEALQKSGASVETQIDYIREQRLTVELERRKTENAIACVDKQLDVIEHIAHPGLVDQLNVAGAYQYE